MQHQRAAAPLRSIRRCAALTLLLSACGDSAGPSPSQPRGSLVSANLMASVPRAAAAQTATLLGAGGAFQANFDVQHYAITYTTVDLAGQSTVASGAIYIPVSPNRSMPLLSYAHGTTTVKNDVPSNPLNLEGQAVGVLNASQGTVVVAADYLGLGRSTLAFHPYLHAQSQASAGLDALRAAKTFAQQRGVALNGQLFITGYSQGGHAAMALHREIEQSASSEFTVTAAAPMSGPYAIYDMARTALQDTVPNRQVAMYALYIFSTWNRIYQFAPNLNQLIRPPHDATGNALALTGLSSGALQNLPATAPGLLQPAVIQALNDPNSAMAHAFRENEVYNWRPRAPVRLYYASADRDVFPQNTLTAAQAMTALGANVQVVNVGPLSHSAAAVPAMIAARLWFNTFQ
jgi:hypothetical protein